MRGECPGQTLQPTALVHEAYLRLVRQERIAWQDRHHFVAIAAISMRWLLVEHARSRAAEKRGGRTTNWTTPLETGIRSSALRPPNPRPFVGLPPVQAPTKCEEMKRHHSLFQQATAGFIFALGKNSQLS
jgi:hypothetical protein